jgi:phospholipase/carboxylesterase
MNRFRTDLDQPQAPAQRPPKLEHALLRSSHRAGVNFSLFAPLHYEPNYGYPLLIWLHGDGDDERQLQRIMPLISMRNYVAIGFRGPAADPHGRRGYGWSESSSHRYSAEQGIFECLDVAAERFNIQRRRVFLAGFRSGGTMALRIGLKHPTKFAGLASICGPFPTGDSPLMHLEQARQLPLLIAQGCESQAYRIEQTCSELRLFHAAGMHVDLRRYPCGDEINEMILRDLNVWLMEQVTGTASSDVHNAAFKTEDDS